MEHTVLSIKELTNEKERPFACPHCQRRFNRRYNLNMHIRLHDPHPFVANAINSIVPDPYMDEIFHIPQAQHYCQGNYTTWDPKLTTPPGLYLISIGLQSLGNLFNVTHLCSVQGLRATNLLFAFLLLLVISAISSRLHRPWSGYHSLSLTWFPISFFYFYLYYTDTGSTLFVLLSYLGVLTDNYFMAGLMGAIAVTFRQTNIIWVFYFMILSIIQLIRSQTNNALYNPTCDKVVSIKDLVHSLHSLARLTLTHMVYIVPRIWTFAITLAGFVAFLIWNNGIVLGDKSNHLAGLHLPQLFYFTSLLSFFSAPLVLTLRNVVHLLDWNLKSLLFGLISTGIMVLAVHYYTFEHPFILADNRHFSFYAWKKIYRRHWSVRYALTPLYYISMRWNRIIIGSHVSVLWMIGYVFTLLLTLVPSPLLEFRYFILPFIFFCIHLPPPSPSNIFITLVTYSLINMCVIYLFLYRPFTWPQNPGEWQRFMW
ncbi:DIE2/ALG10 family-domain-containing protein [Chlamydoabsidia padenii]|nr:DIE2/ALG10 family-domain-containing protein [Chlamydoabsidia padenii]